MNAALEEKKISGWLNLNKPEDITSTQLLNKLKKFLPKKTKLGHAGTLDPFATGVLPVALGEATKLISHIQNSSKEYYFSMKFGSATDTADKTGQVIQECSKFPSSQEIQNILPEFIGSIFQTPPKYSAIKVAGKRSYDLAREGKEVELTSRSAYIYELELINFDENRGVAEIRAVVSKGTYIRTLAEDIAKHLKSLAFVIELRRTKVGKLNIADSLDFNSLLQYSSDKADKYISENIIEPAKLLDDIPVLEVDEDTAIKIKNGRRVYVNASNVNYIAVKSGQHLIAIGKIVEKNFIIKRVFNL